MYENVTTKLCGKDIYIVFTLTFIHNTYNEYIKLYITWYLKTLRKIGRTWTEKNEIEYKGEKNGNDIRM